ncbi:DUF2285 domain-containing protein [Brucella pecoris]|uniref:DUF2285 domain-containing protein n=2 Tax=Brucella pecoris TaxID=867683 RepID=A0AB34Z0X3_9HYPH|nr:DUF2285 domain-containing protein [Brucella pecoris]MBB4096218.1 hypothetical protein [Brucella pecoris]
MFPATVIVEPVPAGFSGCPLLDPLAPAFAGHMAADGFHAVVRDKYGDHYVWLPQGQRVINAVMSIPPDEYYNEREQCVRRFYSWLAGKPSGPLPRWLRFSRYQIHRFSLMLRVWDGVQAGASRQEIASVLINSELGKLRSIDWKNTPERRRIARLLGAAQELIDGGYPRLLCPFQKFPDNPRDG